MRNNKIIVQSNNKIEATSCEEYTIQTFDNPNENSELFLKYLFNSSSNYRIINNSNNLIVSYNDDDLEIVSDLITRYGDKRINLYYSDDEDELRKNITEYRNKRNVYLFLSGVLLASDIVSVSFISEESNFIPPMVTLLFSLGLISSLDTIYQTQIDLTINKRQYKKLCHTNKK
jgi:hypothetical protein